MRLLTAPPISLAPVVGVIVFKIQSELEGRIKREVEGITGKLTSNLCNNPREITKVKNSISNLEKYLNQASNRGEKLRKTIQPIQNVLIALSSAITLLQILPTPNIGTTLGVTNTSAQLLIDLKKLSNELADEITLITLILTGGTGLLTTISSLKESLKAADTFIKNCTENTPITDTVPPTPLTSTPPPEEYLGYTVEVEVVDKSKVAPLRRATARDRLGIIRFTSEQSFSATTDVLISEVKFKIDNNILS